MGKRRAKKNYERRPQKREPNERVLIVCEGKKTERNYFNALLADLSLPPSIDVKVIGDSDPTPDKVIDYAIKWLESEAQESEFGRYQTSVFCVIDRDEHTTFNSAVKRLEDTANSAKYNKKKYKKKPFIKSTKSYPCFEIWYLFHYIQTTKSYAKQGANSPCACLISDLTKQDGIGDYAKGDGNHYDALKGLQPTAINNAEYALREAINVGNPNPSTEIHLLIDYLESIKKRIASEKAECEAS